MKRVFILLAVIMFLISGCGTPAATQDPGILATSIVQTAFAEATANAPTDTPVPSDTPAPAVTQEPQATNTRQPTLEEVRENFLAAVISDLSGMDDVDSVSLVRFNEGALEIELKTRWPLKDLQPDISWTIVKFVADAFAGVERENVERVAGGTFTLALTTYSVLGDYRYQSVTDWETIQKVASKSISFDEWVAAAGAGFR